MTALVDRPPGRVVGVRYTNHRGEERPRQVVLTGRVAAGPTEWHPDAPWTFEVWDLDSKALRLFDPRGVCGGVEAVIEAIIGAAQDRDDRVTRERDVARREREATIDALFKTTADGIRCGRQMAEVKRLLRDALVDVERLERRRDELLETANRYLDRARRMRAAIQAVAGQKAALDDGDEGERAWLLALIECAENASRVS